MSDYPMLISNKLHSFRNFQTAKVHNLSETGYSLDTYNDDHHRSNCQ